MAKFAAAMQDRTRHSKLVHYPQLRYLYQGSVRAVALPQCRESMCTCMSHAALLLSNGTAAKQRSSNACPSMLRWRPPCHAGCWLSTHGSGDETSFRRKYRARPGLLIVIVLHDP